jgi:hypothetical protein
MVQVNWSEVRRIVAQRWVAVVALVLAWSAVDALDRLAHTLRTLNNNVVEIAQLLLKGST